MIGSAPPPHQIIGTTSIAPTGPIITCLLHTCIAILIHSVWISCVVRMRVVLDIDSVLIYSGLSLDYHWIITGLSLDYHWIITINLTSLACLSYYCVLLQVCIKCPDVIICHDKYIYMCVVHIVWKQLNLTHVLIQSSTSTYWILYPDVCMQSPTLRPCPTRYVLSGTLVHFEFGQVDSNVLQYIYRKMPQFACKIFFVSFTNISIIVADFLCGQVSSYDVC